MCQARSVQGALNKLTHLIDLTARGPSSGGRGPWVVASAPALTICDGGGLLPSLSLMERIGVGMLGR